MMENNPLQRKVERRKHFSHDSEKPIGWYLKRVDKLITQNVNDMFAPMGLTRTHWQALNNTYHGRVKTRKDLHELIHDFVDLKTLDDIIDSLVQRGWMIRTEKPELGITELELTDEGNEAFPRLDAILFEFDKQVFQGITEEEYKTAIKVLNQLICNLNHTAH